jgi:hypothetical protein
MVNNNVTIEDTNLVPSNKTKYVKEIDTKSVTKRVTVIKSIV